MNRIAFTGLFFTCSLLLAAAPVSAQNTMEDGSRVILPLETQQCNLPSAPAPIPEVPTFDDLKKAQQGVKGFQAAMETYRECINHDILRDVLTDGNRQAINNAHNYSVDMEERVATMFNKAVRAYKANQPKD